MNETHGDTSVQIGTPLWEAASNPSTGVSSASRRVPQRRDALHQNCSFTESPDGQAFLPCLISMFPRHVGERFAVVISTRTNSTSK